MMRRILLALLLAVAAVAVAQNNPVSPEYPDPVDDSQLGVFADRAYSTLDDALDATDNQITLVDGSRFPDAEFWVIVCPTNQCGVGASAANGETVAICGKASTHVLDICATGRDVQADQTGTSTGDGGNPTHAIGEAVVLAPVAGQINRWLAELKELHDAVVAAAGSGAIVGAGPYSSLPGSGTNGEIYYFRNAPGDAPTPYTHAIHNGSDWVPWFQNYPCEPFVPGDYTWVNQDTALATVTGGATVWSVTTPGDGVHALVKTAPATPYTVEALFYSLYNGSDVAEMGPLWRQSSDGKLILFAGRPTASSGPKWTNPTTYAGSSYWSQNNSLRQVQFQWVRMTDNGTNRITEYSYDGFYWYTVHTVGRTDFLTADQVGFQVYNSGGGSPDMYMVLLSYKVY